MPVKMSAVDPADLRAASTIAPEDIDPQVAQAVNEIVAHNAEAPKDLIHLEFEDEVEKEEWKEMAKAYAAQNRIRLRESGIRGKAANEGYFRAFPLPPTE